MINFSYYVQSLLWIVCKTGFLGDMIHLQNKLLYYNITYNLEVINSLKKLKRYLLVVWKTLCPIVYLTNKRRCLRMLLQKFEVAWSLSTTCRVASFDLMYIFSTKTWLMGNMSLAASLILCRALSLLGFKDFW
jgi:hypothetical protein